MWGEDPNQSLELEEAEDQFHDTKWNEEDDPGLALVSPEQYCKLYFGPEEEGLSPEFDSEALRLRGGTQEDSPPLRSDAEQPANSGGDGGTGAGPSRRRRPGPASNKTAAPQKEAATSEGSLSRTG